MSRQLTPRNGTTIQRHSMIRNGATSQMPCWFAFHASNHAASS
jgi:hypothetical protein